MAKAKKKAAAKKKTTAPKKVAAAKRPKKAAPKPKAKAKAKAKATPKAKAKAAPKAKAKATPKAKAKAAPKAKAKAAPKKMAPVVARRDAAGHLDAKYAKDLRARSKASKDDTTTDAFVGGKRKKDPLADELGKEFVETVTSGEDEGNEIRDRVETEEAGGPFVSSTAGQEFGYDTDASNPKGARREPFPRA